MFIEVKDLEVSFEGKLTLRVDRFSVEEGESVLIVGKSGSGKSTLINCINGVLVHASSANVKGQIKVYGRDVMETPIYELSEVVGTLLQNPEEQVFNSTVEDEVAFGPENLNLPREEIMERVEESMKVTGITSLRERDVDTLSGGEMQMTILASVLALRPKALILDEPTSNIDPKGTSEILSLVKQFREKGKSMLIVEHKTERILPFVDRIVLMEDGRITVDVGKHHLLEVLEKLIDTGVEIPEHLVYAYKRGFREVKQEAFKGFKHFSRQRKPGGDVILRGAARVRSSEGKELVNTQLELRRGTVNALMGLNGSGKTTLLKALMGILNPKLKAQVNLIVDNVDISKKGLGVRGKYLAYLPQNFDVMFVTNSVEKEVSYYMKRTGNESSERLEEILRNFSLTGIRHEDPLVLSMGQRRRVAMASVLATGAKVMMMDEPTSGQDWYHRVSLGQEIERLSNSGLTFLVVTHDSRFVDKFCDRLLVMKDGKIVEDGAPEQVFRVAHSLGVLPPSEYEVA
jgi:ATPase components of various ABC-type transport systems, contain duplicated ATPase